MHHVRRSDDRGHAMHGWLDSHHTFSFAGYYDPAHMGFGDLRVINEDRVAPGHGFPTHGHRDMEIVSYVVEGALEHKDSMGHGSVVRPGDVQRMSAGTGVAHSEYNHSSEEGLHFLQIWIEPERDGLTPSYEQKHFSAEERRGRLLLVASGDARGGSIRIHQNADLYATVLDAGEEVRHSIGEGRRVWVQVVRGELEAGEGVSLEAGDGLAIEDEAELRLVARQPAEAIVFDLA